MSHACIIVALSPDQIQEHGDVGEAVRWNMEPFDENGDWFADGSRWDYWMIGGRFTGTLEPGYDPSKDPANIETCWLCKGTGKRTDMEVPNGCNGCKGTGKTLKWSSKLVNRGNIATRAELEPHSDKIVGYAFLKDRRWCERARMGFWACTAATECERAAREDGEEYAGRCIHECESYGAKIVSWDEDDNDRWPDLYWARFLRNLPMDTTLVVVDYHV